VPATPRNPVPQPRNHRRQRLVRRASGRRIPVPGAGRCAGYQTSDTTVLCALPDNEGARGRYGPEGRASAGSSTIRFVCRRTPHATARSQPAYRFDSDPGPYVNAQARISPGCLYAYPTIPLNRILGSGYNPDPEYPTISRDTNKQRASCFLQPPSIREGFQASFGVVTRSLVSNGFESTTVERAEHVDQWQSGGSGACQ